MKYTYILLLAMVAFLNSALFAAPPAQPVSARSRSIGNHYLNAPLGFEFNRGQADATIAFVSHGGGYTLLLSRREIILRLNHFSASGKDDKTTIRTTFLGSNEHVGIDGVERIQGVSNYLIGADRSHWLRNVPHFARVEYRDIYPGINLDYYGKQNHLEYDFEIAPHANAKSIGFAIEGAHLRVAPTGDLILSTPRGEIAWRKPLAYQMFAGKKHEIPCTYAVAGNEVHFALGTYDPDHPLTIDPPLVWGSFRWHQL